MHTIEITDLNQVIIIDGQEYLLAPKERAEQLIRENKEYRSDIKELKGVVQNILKLLGLMDPETGTIKASIQSGEEGYFKYILKALNKVIGLLMRAQVSKAASNELNETFSFIKNFIPIANKYAGN